MLYNNVLVELLGVALDEKESVALVRDLEIRLAEPALLVERAALDGQGYSHDHDA